MRPKNEQRANNKENNKEEDVLISRDIEPYPGRPASAGSRLKVEEGGVPVWALIGALAADGSNMDAIARDCDVRRDAVEAACAFFQHHREAIDARIADTLG
jgi:uncharacterized protein (DUF433 family)